MSKRQLDIANDFRNEFHKRIEFLEKSISVIVPITKEDEELLKIGINMLTSFDEELQSAESLREFSEFIDIEKLTENWEEVKNRANTTSMAVPDSIHFGKPLDEMINEMGSPDEDD